MKWKYHIKHEQDDIESIRITENSGLSFIFTLQKFIYDSEERIICYMKLGKNVRQSRKSK